ncbi:hypothetical protein Tco_0610128 [Tanacetum coccineum]
MYRRYSGLLQKVMIHVGGLAQDPVALEVRNLAVYTYSRKEVPGMLEANKLHFHAIFPGEERAFSLLLNR